MRHVLSLFDLAPAEIERIFAVTEDIKTKFENGVREPLLPGRVLALLFEKPSLRTRVSFEAGIGHLGGLSLFLGEDVGWGSRESIADFAQVLGQYADAIVCRAKAHSRVVDLARFAGCSVINGLTDFCHPCQALADLYTLQELHGQCRGAKVAYVGDANNVARSLAIGCAKLGASFALASPAAYALDREFVERLESEAPGELLETTDPRAAVEGAQIVYTDVWASMGQEQEAEQRAADFADYQVNSELMQAAPDAHFLHCLPARRGEEVTDDVIDGPQSAVLQQASNRMHVQKGLLAWLLGSQG